MENLLTQASISVRQLQQDLTAYENAVDRQSESQTYQIVTDRIQKLTEHCDRLHILVDKEPAQRRAQSRQRVNEIKYDLVHYQTAFSNIQNRKQQREEAERQRELLLHRKFTPNHVQTNNGATSISLDHSLDYSTRLDSTHAHVDGLLDQGHATLTSLRLQGATLKNIQKKMISMANLLGLSSTVIHSIERRTATDRRILFGGMIVTLFIMFLLYKWLF